MLLRMRTLLRREGTAHLERTSFDTFFLEQCQASIYFVLRFLSPKAEQVYFHIIEAEYILVSVT